MKKSASLHKMMQTFSFSSRIKLKRSYHTNYGSSFYQFHQLELFICISILVFKHILYTTMPYISNAKIDYNFISPSFQYTQLQYFCPQIPQQRAGYSTSQYENHNQTTCWLENHSSRGQPTSASYQHVYRSCLKQVSNGLTDRQLAQEMQTS